MESVLLSGESVTPRSTTEPGPVSLLLEYQFSSNATEPPTGTQIRLDNADPALATKAWVPDVGVAGFDASTAFGLAELGSHLYLQDWDNAAVFTHCESQVSVEHVADLFVHVRVLRDDAPALQLDTRDHHAVAADETPGEIGLDLLFGDLGPSEKRGRAWCAGGS